MGLTATAHSVIGSLRQEVVIDGRHRITTDEPVELGGEGTAPSPHELFPAALASCIATSLVTYARTKSWELGDVTVDVRYAHRATPRRFEVEITLGGELAEDQLERLERVARTCPVRRAIEAGIAFGEEIRIEPPAVRQRHQEAA
jgi:putative redox protein